MLASGYSHVLAEQGARRFEVLRKPYSAEEVSAVLRRAVEGRRIGMRPTSAGRAEIGSDS